jgi:hypothetical protein
MNYTQQQIKLANEIASTLDDHDSIQLHLMYTAKYQETFLRQLLAKVMSIPDEKIRKTRGALYTYLVNQHGTSQKTRY